VSCVSTLRHRTSTLSAPQHSHPFAYGSLRLHMGASVCIWEPPFGNGTWRGIFSLGLKEKCPIYKWDRVPFANGRVPFTNGSYTQTGGNIRTASGINEKTKTIFEKNNFTRSARYDLYSLIYDFSSGRRADLAGSGINNYR